MSALCRNRRQAEKRSSTKSALAFTHIGDKYKPVLWKACSTKGQTLPEKWTGTAFCRWFWAETENSVSVLLGGSNCSWTSSHCTSERQQNHTERCSAHTVAAASVLGSLTRISKLCNKLHYFKLTLYLISWSLKALNHNFSMLMVCEAVLCGWLK